MPRWSERLLVVGHGGTGRTTHVRTWADDAVRHVDGPVAWIRGSFEHYADPTSAASERARSEALSTIEHAVALAVDDAHWLHDDVVDALVSRSADAAVCAALAPWPDSSPLQRLASALTVRDPAVHLGPMSTDEVADVQRDGPVTDVPTDALLRFTGGSPALTRFCVDHQWSGDSDDVPAAVVDAVVRLARQSGHDVVQLLQLMALGLRLNDAVAAVLPLRDDAERRLRASGLVADDRPLGVVTTALRHDLTRTDRQALGALVAGAGVAASADVRAQIDLTGTDVARRAAAAFRLGHPDAERLVVSALATSRDAEVTELRFGIDMRSMRWSEAAATDNSGFAALARAFAADIDDVREHPADRDIADQLRVMMLEHARGASDVAMAIGADAVERAHALDFAQPLGWSPAAVGALVALGAGDARTARSWALHAIDTNASGDGEQRCHRLIAALAGIALNEFSEALDLVRHGADLDWALRDRFLLAAIDASIARRSGDTARLRSAWQQCEPLLVGQPVSWLLADPLLEVLCAGARLGDLRRVGPAAERLVEQLRQLPAEGPGAAASYWLRLHLAIAADDWTAVAEHTGELAALRDGDRRSTARIAAGRAWEQIATVRASEGDGAVIDLAAVDDAVDQLVAVDDAWEASRLLGQAALDHGDASVARGLLERARNLVTDPIETADGLIAAGLSEREADVARLVADGRTYKDIGAQLFISAKTVEHHVARIRQRLGAGTRAEMLATIREMT
jgi:DNA-binding CsgD family transcriptional regulator